ncbi:MAG TPA: wax ester/triacylglycerol synthase family O-acyltransferase [Candidatus Binatia bacterium]|nr:wax ester/triacylglycerol synthase family O-acyltransferase [Candidatus Binatia bacterium]
MERLSGIDASFLYMETPTLHMHTIKVAVLEPARGVDYSVARVKADLRDRLHLLPPFRRRLVEVPFGFHHPVWIEDPDFDLDHHLRHATAAAPGGPREMDALVSEIASVPLDRRRPLWELWVVDGLAGGQVAAVGKIHHAVADGVAVAALLANVMAPDLAGLAPPATAAAWSPDRAPSRARLLRDALHDHRHQLAALPALVRTTARNLRAAARYRRHGRVAPPLPLLHAPGTCLDGALTARRAFASTALPLGELRAVKEAAGVTLNDVVLALVAGALGRYLVARGGLPTRPLVAEVPVGTDPPGARRLGGNRLSNLFTSLCTDVADPAARLRAIHEVTRAAKELHALLGPELYQAWTQYAPPRLFAWWMRWYSRLRLADWHGPPVNAIVSTVPGPRVPLAWSGGQLAAVYSVGPIVEGVPLNVTAWSYVDRLCVGVLTCPRQVADPHEITDGLQQALAELRAAVPARSRGAAGRGA